MWHGPDAGGRKRDLALVLSGECDEFRNRFRRRRVRRHHQERKRAYQRDRRKIADGVRQRAIEKAAGREGRGAHEHRVAVGVGACDRRSADVGAGAGLVLNHHLLAPDLGVATRAALPAQRRVHNTYRAFVRREGTYTAANSAHGVQRFTRSPRRQRRAASWVCRGRSSHGCGPHGAAVSSLTSCVMTSGRNFEAKPSTKSLLAKTAAQCFRRSSSSSNFQRWTSWLIVPVSAWK